MPPAFNVRPGEPPIWTRAEATQHAATAASSDRQKPVAMTPQQQQQASQSSLHQLQAMLNGALEQLGRAIDSPAKLDAPRLAQSKREMHVLVANFRSGFHDALDELESELAAARNVMRRDLAEHIAKRKRLEEEELAARRRVIEREQPAAAEKAGVPAAGAVNGTESSKAHGAGVANGVANGETNGTSNGALDAAAAAAETSAQLAGDVDVGVEIMADTDDLDIDFDSMFEDVAGPSAGGQSSQNAGDGEFLSGLEMYANELSQGEAADGSNNNNSTNSNNNASNTLNQSDFDFMTTDGGDAQGGGDAATGTGTAGDEMDLDDLFSFNFDDGMVGGGGTDFENELFGTD